MEGLRVFSNEEFGSVRSLMVNGEPYFVGKDVTDILGYSNSRDALAKRVDDEDKGVAKCDTPGGAQDLVVINESGLYSLVLSSKLPAAKRFKHWVTSEVLPSIRRYGVYAVEQVLSDPDMLIAALQALKDERQQRKALEEENAEQKKQIAEMEPKATYYDVVLACPDAVAVSVIAKDYGKSAKWLNSYLEKKGIQYKLGGKIWLLYQKYAENGYTCTKTHTQSLPDGSAHARLHTYWTQKGRLFIYETLKEDGILPVMEKAA